MIQAGGNTLHSRIHELINPTMNKEEMPQQQKEFMIVLIYKSGDKTVVITEEYYCYQLCTKFIQYSSLKVNSVCR
jgi:hypothetical protein